MQEFWFRPLIWVDYRLAVFFLVGLPLVLLIWATFKRAEAIQKLLIIYWRVASLLMITVYVMIAGWSIGFVSGFAARLLIPISLWFWVDANDEIADAPASSLKLVFTAWRWAVTLYCTLASLLMIPFLSCTFAGEAVKTNFCSVWLEPTWLYREWFHANSTPGFLGFVGMTGLCIYAIYLVYFLLLRLGKQGRSAMEQ